MILDKMFLAGCSQLVFTLIISLVYTSAYAGGNITQGFMVKLPQESVPELPRNFGWLLMQVDISGAASSIEFGRRLPGHQMVDLAKVQPGKNSHGYILVAMKKGRYATKKINAPYFNLPWQKNTEGSKYWDFDVQPKKINYFGKVYISKSRTNSYVEIRRINLFSDAVIWLREQLFAEGISMRSAFSYRDDFADILEEDN